jgi:integrase
MTLIEAVRTTLRRLHYSPRTEEAYVHWICEFIRFHHGRYPREMGAVDATAFLNHLAVQRRTSASTQNQALCALVFLYRRVLAFLKMPDLEGLERARRPEHLPAVLSRREVIALLDRLTPPFRLIGELLYGSGLRLLESLAVGVKDVDLERRPPSAPRAHRPANPRPRPTGENNTALYTSLPHSRESMRRQEISGCQASRVFPPEIGVWAAPR